MHGHALPPNVTAVDPNPVLPPSLPPLQVLRSNTSFKTGVPTLFTVEGLVGGCGWRYGRPSLEHVLWTMLCMRHVRRRHDGSCMACNAPRETLQCCDVLCTSVDFLPYLHRCTTCLRRP
jgi:hypothetical protein